MRTKIVRKTCAGKFEQLRTLNPGILLIVSSEVFEDVQKPCTPKAEATGSNPVGCAISGNPQNSGVFEFTRQQCDGHLMTASGPEVVSRLTEGKGQKAETMGATAPLGHADRDREAS